MGIKRLMAVTLVVLVPVIVGCGPPQKQPLPLGWFTDGTYEMGHDATAGFIPPGIYMSEADGNEDSAARLDAAGNLRSGVVADRVIIAGRQPPTPSWKSPA